jgi:hypothetical protein
MSGCTTYPLARDVQYIAFEEPIGVGRSVGEVEADDCVWSVLGYPLGTQPTISRAMANARLQRKSGMLDSFSSGSEGAPQAGNKIRYLTNVSSGTAGFNAKLISKYCVTVKGVGYQ